jgi:hypothetical protein
VAHNDHALFIDDDRLAEPEFADRPGDGFDGGVVVDARVW